MHDTTETTKQYQCRHIFTDGRRCASPCLRQEEFCYYHHTARKPVADPRQRRSRRSTFHLPLPEDRSAVQSAIGEVIQRIASNDIDPRRAGLLLYGLQIASLNLGKTQPATETSDERETVEEIIIDPTLGVLAPRAEVSKPTTRKTVVGQLIERLIQSGREESISPTPDILPALQAAEDTAASNDISSGSGPSSIDATEKGTNRSGAIRFSCKRFGHGKQRQRHKTKVQLLPPTQPPKIALIGGSVAVDLPEPPAS